MHQQVNVNYRNNCIYLSFKLFNSLCLCDKLYFKGDEGGHKSYSENKYRRGKKLELFQFQTF